MLTVDLGSNLGLFSTLPLFHEVHHGLRGQVLQAWSLSSHTYLINVLVVDLNHGCVDACAQALDLTDCEQAVLAGSVHLNIGMILDGLDDVSGTTELARSGTAYLEVILSDLGSVEHRVERGNLVHLHGLHVQDLSDLVHGGECEEVVVLFLSDEQSRDACALLVVARVLIQQVLNLFVVLLGELKRSVLIIVLSVSVIGKCREISGIAAEGGGSGRVDSDFVEECS